MGCSPLSPGANIVSCLVLSRLSLLPFLIKIILPVMWDFYHLHNSLSEDICRYVSKDTNFQWVKCNIHVGISTYTFAFSIHFLTFFGGIQHFPSHPQQQPAHELSCMQALSHRLSTNPIHCPTNSQLPSTAIPSLFQRHSVSLPTRFWLPSNSILIPSRTPPFTG